jgi:WD40 repeat protein
VTLKDYDLSVSCLAVLKNGDLAAGSVDFTIKIWDMQKMNEKMALIGHESIVSALVVLENGDLASGSWHQIFIWDIQRGIRKKTFDINYYNVNCLANLQSINELIIGLYGQIKILSIRTEEIIQTIVDSNYSVSSLAVLPNGNFASGSFKQIKLYQKNNKTWILKRIFDETGIINSLAIFPNGDFASGSKSKITIYESKTQNVKQIISDFDHYVQILVTLPSGELAIGTNNGLIEIINSSGNVRSSLKAHSKSVTSLALLSNGKLASGSDDRSIKIWDV